MTTHDDALKTLGTPAEEEPHWDSWDMGHGRGTFAELLAVERLHQHYGGQVTWFGPHHALYDVTVVIGSIRQNIDVKSAWMAADGRLSFMGSARDTQVRPGVHLYALVVLENCSMRAVAPADGGLGLDVRGHIDGDVYLVKPEVVNSSTPADKQDGTAGSGLMRYLTLDGVQKLAAAPPG